MARLLALLAVAGCGRIGFASLGSGTGGSDASGIDGAGPNNDGPGPSGDVAGSAGSTVGFGGVIIDPPGCTTSPCTFTGAAANAGDLVVFQVTCAMGAVTASSLSAPGWTISAIGSHAQVTLRMLGVDTFGAIAPDTATTTFTITNGGCIVGVQAAEFANVAGGSVSAVDGVLNAGQTCSGSLTTARADDTLWAACTMGDLSSPSPGYTLVDATAEYRVTTDPAGTGESVNITSVNGALFSFVAVAPN